MQHRFLTGRGRFAMILAAVFCLSGLLAASPVQAAGAAPAASQAATDEKKPIHVLFTNVNIFDGFSDKLANGMSVFVEDNYIKKVGKDIQKPEGAYEVDGQGRTLSQPAA